MNGKPAKPGTDRERERIRVMLAKKYRGAIEPADAMIDAVLAGLEHDAGQDGAQ